MRPLVVSAMFSLLLLIVCWSWPSVGRRFMGVFFLVMAVGVNLSLVVAAPHLFVEIGTAAPLVGWYERFFDVVVASAPAQWGLAVVAYEVTVALLLLWRGSAVVWGIAGGVAFLLAITPMGTFTLADPVLALAVLALLRAPRKRHAFARHAVAGEGPLPQRGSGAG